MLLSELSHLLSDMSEIVFIAKTEVWYLRIFTLLK